MNHTVQLVSCVGASLSSRMVDQLVGGILRVDVIGELQGSVSCSGAVQCAAVSVSEHWALLYLETSPRSYRPATTHAASRQSLATTSPRR